MNNEIKSITTKEQVKRFYIDNLIYPHSVEGGEKEVLKKVTKSDLEHLYCIIYNRDNCKLNGKLAILNSIENYFRSIERAKMLKG